MTTRKSLAVLIAACLAAVVWLPSCSKSNDDIKAKATFDDVADLADGAPVMLRDVTVGSVTDIGLDPTGRRATVTFTVRRSAKVPESVEAQVRRTTALGEKFIDLVPTGEGGGQLLASGATIKTTRVVSDLEQLVGDGSAALGALSASQIATLLDESSTAIGGRGGEVGDLLNDLADVTDAYAANTGEVTELLASLDQLSTDLAPTVEANGQTLDNLNTILDTLNENDRRFIELVGSLNGLSGRVDVLLRDHLDEIRQQLSDIRIVTGALADEQVSIGDVLRNLPTHNRLVPQGERGGFAQVLIDLTLCGVPGGGDVPGDPVDACYPNGAP